MASVEITPEDISHYLSLKLGHSFRYIAYKVSTEMTQIFIAKQDLAAAAAFADFVAALPVRDAHQTVYDFPYVQQDGTTRNKILFVIWTPAIAKEWASALM